MCAIELNDHQNGVAEMLTQYRDLFLRLWHAILSDACAIQGEAS